MAHVDPLGLGTERYERLTPTEVGRWLVVGGETTSTRAGQLRGVTAHLDQLIVEEPQPNSRG